MAKGRSLEEGAYVPPERRPLVAKKLSSESSLTSQPPSDSERKAGKLYKNFVKMCLAFSLNHACVVTCLAYASTVLGSKLGGLGSGFLYICFSLSSFLFAKPLVAAVGPANGLFFGVVGYCVYIAGFLFAVTFSKHSLAWPFFLVAASIGGISGGILWPAQGKYFAQNAKMYAEATGEAQGNVSASFAGVFASFYLGLELVIKVLATIVFLLAPEAAYYIIFALYFAIALVACLIIAYIDDLDSPGDWNFDPDVVVGHVGSVARLVEEDEKLRLMIPYQVAFGLCSSFVPYYIFGTVISGSGHLGASYVGLLSAVIVLVGAGMAMPASWLANKLGKPFVMTIGGMCLFMAGATLLVVSDDVLGTWLGITLYLVIYGMGRGTWENTNKAVIADMYSSSGIDPGHATTAFATVAFSNGFAGAIGYFTFPFTNRLTMAVIVATASVVAIVSYWLSLSDRLAHREL